MFVPGLMGLIAGMYESYRGNDRGAGASAAGLLLFAAFLADTLRRAGSIPVVAAYGWAALHSLILLVVLGITLSIDYETGFLADHTAVDTGYMILGGFGFMGMLALGFSHVLVPMFALSSTPDRRLAYLGFGAAVSAVILGVTGALLGDLAILSAACFVGLLAAAAHLRLMHVALSTGMRKRLGLSFVLVRISWAMLALTPLVGMASASAMSRTCWLNAG